MPRLQPMSRILAGLERNSSLGRGLAQQVHLTHAGRDAHKFG